MAAERSSVKNRPLASRARYLPRGVRMNTLMSGGSFGMSRFGDMGDCRQTVWPRRSSDQGCRQRTGFSAGIQGIDRFLVRGGGERSHGNVAKGASPALTYIL